jgi:hypothetical protein
LDSGASVIYTAPTVAPSPIVILITATPVADPSKAAAIEVNVQEPVLLLPTSATRAVNHRQRFDAVVQNLGNNSVTWLVNGIAGGNSAVGRVCTFGSNPCQGVTTAEAGTVEYLAPSAVPAPNPVTLSVVSQADPTRSASSPITILPHIVVTVSPPSATVAPGAKRIFTASVLGTSDQQVVWQIAGAACAGPGAPCGTVNPAGLYTAPTTPPTPNTLSVIAVSSEDTSRSGSASVTIPLEPVILTLRPSSAMAGASGGTTLRVEGGNFAATSPGPGSIIRMEGNARATLCESSAVCSTTLMAADLSSAGNRSVTVQNPNGALSAPAALVVVGPTAGADNILLTPNAPNVTGKDIVVVDLSTSGSSAPTENVNLNIVSLSLFQPATGACTVGGGPATLARPTSGTAIEHLCAFSVSGLDPSLDYTLSGPSTGDITIMGKEPLGLGIVHLTLALPATARTGARTLFIRNANGDVTAASGALEIR